MVALNCLLKKAKSGGFLLGWWVSGRGGEGVKVLHMLFANDTLVFCEPSHDQLTYLCWLLMCFEAIYGLKFNLKKSDLILVGSMENVDELAQEFECKDFLWEGGALEWKPYLVWWTIIGSGELSNKKSLTKNTRKRRSGGGGDELLRSSFPSLFALAIFKEAWVVNVWSPSSNGGCWAPCLSRRLNDWEVDLVESFFLRLQRWRVSNDEEDRLVWLVEKSGKFSIKALYKVVWGKVLTLDLLKGRGCEGVTQKLTWVF
ncbi:hypothetical protein CK203_086070 [Vitis vinifera]|uniref:Reverse transcriptase domain-containing protein n=1 Tax=Vitis vinifera TaxID=29760 RepID=A0A438D513_VITVI|nr:hypothetical protein CK203_086070 [Vitis vinifera]